MFSFLESGHYFGTAKKGIVDNQFGTERVYYICVCYHQNLTLHKDRVNNFLLDDDKPNDHIDYS